MATSLASRGQWGNGEAASEAMAKSAKGHFDAGNHAEPQKFDSVNHCL